MTEIPTSRRENWDALAKKLVSEPRQWVLVRSDPPGRRGGRNQLVREIFARRGLKVEVVSRRGNLTPERPWIGWRTWARLIREGENADGTTDR